MNENVEEMAREYNRTLSVSAEEETTLEQMVLNEENQLDALNDLSMVRASLTVRTVGYLKNLIFRSLNELNGMLGNTSYIPSIRNNGCPSSPARAVLSLYDSQLNLFILSDKLPTSAAAERLKGIEDRKSSLIVALLR